MPVKYKSKKHASDYVSVHMWLYRHYGKAAKCEICGSVGGGKRYEWANLSGNYLRDRADFKEMCRPCHENYDRQLTCKRGHEYTKESTYVSKHGYRTCKICMRIAYKKYDKKRVRK